MIGTPKYTYGDKVKFSMFFNNGEKQELHGFIYIVDAYGTFFDDSEVFYDVMVTQADHTPILFKHISESGLEPIQCAAMAKQATARDFGRCHQKFVVYANKIYL